MSKPTKSAVVFGVGPRQGVGAELCFRAAKEGLHTFVNGRSEDKVLAIVDAIRAWSIAAMATSSTLERSLVGTVGIVFTLRHTVDVGYYTV